MADLTKQDLVDALNATKQELIQEIRASVATSERYIVGAVGKQLRVIVNNMATKEDLKASERRQSRTVERAFTKHVVTWHDAQLQ